MAGTLKKELFLLAVLFVFAVIDITEASHFSCKRFRRDGSCEEHWHRSHRSFNHGRRGFGKRSIAEDEQRISTYYGYDVPSTPRTSCGNPVCVSTWDYPYQRINDAVNQVRRIISSRHPRMEHLRKRIDPEVLNFHSKSSQQSPIVDRTVNVGGCKVHVNVTRPQEGYSSDDRKTYYIVNIPSLQQRVHFVKCLGGSPERRTCSSGNDDGVSTCRQAYRDERLLALPKSDYGGRFSAVDFKIRSFRVPNGCECGADDISVMWFDEAEK